MSDRTTWVAVLITAAVAAVVVFADDLAPEPETPPTPTAVTAVADPVAGSWVCGVGAPDERSTLTTMIARSGDPGEPPAQIDWSRFAEDEVTADSLPALFPGSHTRLRVEEEDEPDGPSASRVAWRDGPVVAWREWRLSRVPDVPDVTISGSCAQPSSSQWTVPGLSTQDGDEAILTLSNPFGSAANVAVTFLTPEGEQRPLALENLTVPAGSVREVVVSEALPEEPDLAAVVEVTSGRLSVEGVQFGDSELGEVDGGSLLASAPEPAEQWVVPWAPQGEDAESWLWVANPGERTAAVELVLHTEDGGQVPAGLAEVNVPPGELRRVDLDGTFPEDADEAAVAARSDGAPVVMSVGSRVLADDPAASGLAVQLGASGADTSWVVAGRNAEDREEELRLVNPTGSTATVDVSLFTGGGLVEPSELQGVEVPAGSSRIVELTDELDGAVQWTAFVEASEGEVVAGRVGRADDEDARLRLVAVPGVPSSAWAADASGLAAVGTEGLVTRLRTAGGAGVTDPGVGGDEAPAEDPAVDGGAPDDEEDEGIDVPSDQPLPDDDPPAPELE